VKRPACVSDGDAQVVELAMAGELDLAAAPALAAALDAVARSGVNVVVVNMAAVTFIDSTGLHALLDAKQALATTGGRLHLTEPSPAATRLFQLAGLGDHFAVDPIAATADVVTADPLEVQLRALITPSLPRPS
jgi:anti-sigma B factor antagonist